MEGLVGFRNLRNAEIKCLLQTSELQEAEISPLEKIQILNCPTVSVFVFAFVFGCVIASVFAA